MRIRHYYLVSMPSVHHPINVILNLIKTMYKIILASILVFIASIQSWGQNDRYSDIRESIGQTIQMYDMDKLYDEYQSFIYTKNAKGKLVKEKDPQAYIQVHNKHLKVVGIENIKKNTYWVLEDNGKILYFIIDDIDYCKNIKSVSYWEQEYNNYSTKYSYYIPSGMSVDELESYQLIHWIGLEMPHSFIESPSIKFETSQMPVTLVSPSIVKNENGFLTQEEYLCIRERITFEKERQRLEMERLDSIADHNHIIQVRLARKPVVYEYFERNGVFKDAPKFKHLNLEASYGTPSQYTTYSIEREWDYYFTIYNYNPANDTYLGFCKGQEIELPKVTFAKNIHLKEEQYLIRRGTRGVDIRKKVALEHDKSFYSSSKHLEKIQNLKPNNKSNSSSTLIGRKYVVQKEYYDFQHDYLRVIATDEVLKKTIPNDAIFTCIDICEDTALMYAGNVVIFENPKYGYCWLESTLYVDSYLDEYDDAVKKNQKRKEWERKMIDNYGETNGKLIITGKVRIGFTAEMCRNAWGRPSDINRTTTAYGVHEQWVYDSGNYLYFEDGILTTIQN